MITADFNRIAVIVAMAKRGDTLAEIGVSFNVSRERVRQILAKYGNGIKPKEYRGGKAPLCARCNKKRTLSATGKCTRCRVAKRDYAPAVVDKSPCTNCGKPWKDSDRIRGLCRLCYQKWRYNSDSEYRLKIRESQKIYYTRKHRQHREERE